MSLKIKIDVQSLAKQCKEFALEAEQDLKKGVKGLAASTHAHVIMMASEELKSSRKPFLDNLGFEEIAEGVWIVSVDEKGLWVEEGIEPNTDMKPDLLKNGKISPKTGYKYQIIPFKHSSPPSDLTDKAKAIVAQIKTNLKKEGVPFKNIEKDVNGKPKLGKLHSFNWGGEIPGKGNTPVLKGVSIYQTLTATGNTRRDILTFRTVSGSPASAGKFIHPGLKAKKYLDIACEWASRTWENEILPEILNKWK